jgi:hypothetical protein
MLIQKNLDNGIRKFAIYPYGDNGVRIANMLRDFYNIEPIYIVDNSLCKYNFKIINFEKFKELFEDDLCVILSIEQQSINLEMENALKEFAPNINIINVITSDEKNFDELDNSREVTDQFLLDNILPQDALIINDDADLTRRKIKVRLLHTSAVMWNALKTICEAFEMDEKYDVLVILWSCSSNETVPQMEKGKHKYILENEYDAESDRPDIFIVTQPWAVSHIPNVRKSAKLVIAALMTLYDYNISPCEFWKTLKRGFEQYKPDYYLLDSGLYSELKEYGYRKEQLIEMGNAKYDGIYEACKTIIYPDNWDKLKGRKTILWITTHGIYNNRISDVITFDLYAKTIFEYAYNNTEVGFIFRPHISFINELLKYGYWNENDLKKIKLYCEHTPNVVWDERDSYDSALSVADAVLTDAHCGVIYSALPTMKPICTMYRYDKCSWTYDDKLLKNYYSARNNEEIVSFIEMVKSGQDIMYEMRKKASEKYVKNFDGKNGLRIKKFIEKKFMEMDL